MQARPSPTARGPRYFTTRPHPNRFRQPSFTMSVGHTTFVRCVWSYKSQSVEFVPRTSEEVFAAEQYARRDRIAVPGAARPVGRSTIFTPIAASMRGASTPFRTCCMYRNRGLSPSIHNLSPLECVEPVPPSAGVACTDPAGRSFGRFLTAWGLCSIPRASSVPTPRDAHSFSQPAGAWVRGACTPFRVRCLYRPAGRSPSVRSQLLLECEGPVHASRGVVCTDSWGRSFSRCLSARD